MACLLKYLMFILFNTGILAFDPAKNSTELNSPHAVLYYQPEQVHISIGGKLI